LFPTLWIKHCYLQLILRKDRLWPFRKTFLADLFLYLRHYFPQSGFWIKCKTLLFAINFEKRQIATFWWKIFKLNKTLYFATYKGSRSREWTSRWRKKKWQEVSYRGRRASPDPVTTRKIPPLGSYAKPLLSDLRYSWIEDRNQITVFYPPDIPLEKVKRAMGLMEDPFDWSVLRPTSPKNIKWVYFPPLEKWMAKVKIHGNNISTCMLCWPITLLIQQYEQSRIAMWNVAIVIYVFIIIGTKIKCIAVTKSNLAFSS